MSFVLSWSYLSEKLWLGKEGSGKNWFLSDSSMGSKNSDINYEEVGMEVSDEEGSGSGNESLFSSKEEYLAYKSQFKGKTKAQASKLSKETSEYGTTQDSEYGSVEPVPKKSKPSSPSSENSDSSDDEEEGSRTAVDVKKYPSSLPSTASKSSHQFDRISSKADSRQRREHDRRDHDKDRRRDRRKDKERDRDRIRDRDRDRERERGRERRSDRSHHRSGKRDHDRDHRRGGDHSPPHNKRNRKLLACGLTTQEQLDAWQKEKETGEKATSSGAGQSQLEAQSSKTKEEPNLEMPKYYNPQAMNTLKLTDQIKKRQMLWSKPKPEAQGNQALEQSGSAKEPKQSFNKWESTNFGNSQVNEKFRRLMGIKGGAANPSAKTEQSSSSSSVTANLEQQYERARAITHTQRGLGLGFGGQSSLRPPDQS